MMKQDYWYKFSRREKIEGIVTALTLLLVFLGLLFWGWGMFKYVPLNPAG